MARIPFDRVNWTTSGFLMGTLALTLTAVPAYIWHFGLDWFQIVLFLVMFCACGFSITLGYHRLFAHRAFKAHWSVRLFTLVFGAAAFENSALMWTCEHRTHHKHVDHDEDPYDISKGFFHAHMGWLMFKLNPGPNYENVSDLKKDRLVMWQHRHVQSIAVFISFILPAVLGFLWGGWSAALGAFLIAGVARIVVLQHCTFFINSLCHTIGSRPYSSKCTARDSWLMALFTFGEGYHNYHHEFQHDYRNGVKPWHFDPTKWIVWSLAKAGLADHLRRVPEEKILLAEVAEKQRQLALQLSSADGHSLLQSAHERLQLAARNWELSKNAYISATQERLAASRERIAELRRELEAAARHMREALEHWRTTYGMLLQECRLAQ